jgi:ABC-2 type transport system permease protein
LDQPIGNAGWIAAAWLTVAVMVSVPTAAVLFRRRTT